METILNISNLSIGFVHKKQKDIVASNIYVAIDEPKFIALIGENGIGKSTLLRTISKVQPCLSGKIHLFDKDLKKLSNLEVSKKISLVLTERIPPSNLTVFELIALGRQVYTNWIGTLQEDDFIKINEAITFVKIEALKEKKMDELSDGQYQKVMIARAIAQDTPIIILDEPTAHLDLTNKAFIFKLLKNLVMKFKKTVIISSHELQLALQVVDDFWLLTNSNFTSMNKQDLIESNLFKKVFNSDIVQFNKEHHTFKIK